MIGLITRLLQVLIGPPALFVALALFISASMLFAASEVRATRPWTGLAASGRVALVDHRDVADAGLRVLTDPALWAHAPRAHRPRADVLA